MEIQGFDKVLILWWKKNQNQNKTLTFKCYPKKDVEVEICKRFWNPDFIQIRIGERKSGETLSRIFI